MGSFIVDNAKALLLACFIVMLMITIVYVWGIGPYIGGMIVFGIVLCVTGYIAAKGEYFEAKADLMDQKATGLTRVYSAEAKLDKVRDGREGRGVNYRFTRPGEE